MNIVEIPLGTDHHCDECHERVAIVKITFKHSDDIFLCDEHKKELGELFTNDNNNGILITG